jgi:hypothetical protein
MQTYATISPELREHYKRDNVEIFQESGNPQLSPLIAKLETRNDINDSAGLGFIIPVTTARGGSVSMTFSNARAKSKGTTTGSAATHKRWVVQPKTMNATAHWDREAILAAKGPGEVFDVFSSEINAKFSKLKHRLAIHLQGAGYGRVATIVGAPTSTYFTVSASTINRFEIGDDVEVSATESGALRAGGALTVTGVDPDTYRVYCADPSSLSWASGDVVFFAGDHTNATITCPMGLGGYLPDAAPTTDLFSLVRTNDPSVSGIRLNCSSYDMVTSLTKLAQRLHLAGAPAKQAYVSVEDFANLSLDKDRVKIVDMQIGKYNIGFGAAILSTPAGPITIHTEMLQEQGRIWMGDFDNKDYAPFIVHTGDLVECDDFSGVELKDVDGETVYEQRWFSRLNLAFPGPGKFGVGYGVPA